MQFNTDIKQKNSEGKRAVIIYWCGAIKIDGEQIFFYRLAVMTLVE